jgi:flagellar M-ring protein FliF
LEGQQGINQGASLASVAKGSHLEEKTSDIEEQMAVSSDEIERSEIGLTPKKVTVSVSVPRRYFADIWRQQNPTTGDQAAITPDPKQLAQIETDTISKIKQTVAVLLPQPADVTDPLTLVTVQPFDDLPVAEITGPGVAEKATSWFGQNWSTLGMIGLAGFSLVMLRSMINSPANTPAPMPAAAPSPSGGAFAAAVGDEPSEKTAEDKAVPKSRLKRHLSDGPSLRDELAEIVREDPDGAATILRSWIGNMS